MAIQVYEAKQKLTETDLDELESRLGLKLPLAYRQWLLAYNGGSPDPNSFRFKGETGPYTESCIAWFCAVKSKYNDIENKYRTFVLCGRIPNGLLPIAIDPGGNNIVLGHEGPDAGKVYFWDHEEEGDEEDGAPSRDNLHLIADSFEEFINGLY